MDLEKVFKITSEKMKSEWEQIRSSMSHSGDKGRSLENTVKEFFRKYLPESLDISEGEIIDSKGNSSRQMDIIIYDKIKTVKLFGNNEIRIIPIECVYAIIEVKSNIDSTATIDDIFEKMKSVKNLEKIAYYSPDTDIIHFVNLYGKELKIWPVHFFVFSIESMALEKLGSYIDTKHKMENLPEEKRIDCVCVLSKGVIMNQLEQGTFSALPEPNSKIVYRYTENSLLFFYTLVSRYLNQAWIPAFDFIKYTKGILF